MGCIELIQSRTDNDPINICSNYTKLGLGALAGLVVYRLPYSDFLTPALGAVSTIGELYDFEQNRLEMRYLETDQPTGRYSMHQLWTREVGATAFLRTFGMMSGLCSFHLAYQARDIVPCLAGALAIGGPLAIRAQLGPTNSTYEWKCWAGTLPVHFLG